MRTTATARLVLSALLCALTAVLSQIHIPLPPVPMSLSLLGVHLCGALLSPRHSAGAMGAYLALGACGVPVFAGFGAGPSVLLGPTGGFLAGYIPCALLCGWTLRRFGPSRRALLAGMAAGTCACYACGLAYFMLVTGSAPAEALTVCILPFLPGDAVKILLAAAIAPRLFKPLSSLGLCAHFP